MKRKTLKKIACFLFVQVLILSMGACKAPIKEELLQSNTNEVVVGAKGYGQDFSVSGRGFVYGSLNRVCYYDIPTDVSYVVCGKANCSHLGDDCPAWYGLASEIHGVALYQDQVLVLKKDEKRNEYVLRASTVGGEDVRELASFPVGDYGPGNWVMTGVQEVYYAYGYAIIGFSYLKYDQKGNGTIVSDKYVKVSLADGKVQELISVSEEARNLSLQGITEQYILFSRIDRSLRELSCDEFYEQYEAGVFGEFVADESVEGWESWEAWEYYLYTSKWFPQRCEYTNVLYTVSLETGEETVLEELPAIVEFSPEGALVGAFPNYYLAGMYKGRILMGYMKEGMAHEPYELFFLDPETGEKETLARLGSGGVQYWERGNLGQPLDRTKEILFIEYLDDEKGIIMSYDLETGETKELFEDAKNFSFRIIDSTEEYFIGKRYREEGEGVSFTLLLVPKEEYYKGNRDAEKKLRY